MAKATIEEQEALIIESRKNVHYDTKVENGTLEIIDGSQQMRGIIGEVIISNKDKIISFI